MAESAAILDGRQERRVDRYYIDVVGVALNVLETIARSPRGISQSDISRELGADKTRILRVLRTLHHHGYVDTLPESKNLYVIGQGALGGTGAVTFNRRLEVLAQSTLVTTSLALRHSVSLGVLEGSSVRYIARARFQKIISADIEVGTSLPAHATSMGKLLLAHQPPDVVAGLYDESGLVRFTPHTVIDPELFQRELATVRDVGYAISDQELEANLRGIAVPVRGETGDVIAAVSASYVDDPTEKRELSVDALMACAAEVQRKLADR